MAGTYYPGKSFSVAAIMPAAGSGVRMGGALSKQFLDLGGKPILAVTLDTFENCPAVQEIFPVVPPKDVEFCRKEIIEPFGYNKVRKVVPGGRTRQESVRLGLEATEGGFDYILIHDGVRPFVSIELIEKSIQMAEKYGAAISALPAKETLKEINELGEVVMTIDRNNIWLVQTPQVFKYEDIVRAHRRAVEENFLDSTDDSLLVERLGVKVSVIEGSEDNIKITSPQDLELAGFILGRRK
ncbi:2-C-methyl-D-erythritol 4-phosphate cytidylyltransferase [Thermodesulfobacteriota bacterium]